MNNDERVSYCLKFFLNFDMLCNFFIPLFLSADFFRMKVVKNSSKNTVRVSNYLDPDQALHSVCPDLCPNCFQRLSADDKGHP